MEIEEYIPRDSYELTERQIENEVMEMTTIYANGFFIENPENLGLRLEAATCPLCGTTTADKVDHDTFLCPSCHGQHGYLLFKKDDTTETILRDLKRIKMAMEGFNNTLEEYWNGENKISIMR